MKHLFSCFFLFCFIAGNCQTRVTDSLLQVIKTAKEDTNKLNMLNNFCLLLFRSKPPTEIMKYANEAKALGEKLIATANNAHIYSVKKGLAKATNIEGLLQNVMNNSNGAIASCLEALRIYTEIGDKAGVSASYNNLGLFYDGKGDFVKSLEYHLKSLKLKEEIGDKPGTAASYNNMGNIFRKKGDNDKAIEHYKKAAALREELNDTYGAAQSYGGIGTAYANKRDFENSLKFYETALSLFTKLGATRDIGRLYSNIATLYSFKGDADNSIKFDQRSLNISLLLGDSVSAAISSSNIGKMHYRKGNFKKARRLISNSIQLLKKKGSETEFRNLYSALSTCDSVLGDFKAAYLNARESERAGQRIFNSETARQLSELQTKYETEKKEKENQLLLKTTEVQELQLNQKNYFIFTLILAFFLIAFAALLITRQNKLRAEQRNAQLEQKLLRSQMNPHFIFNSLTAIDSYIYTKKTQEARQFLSDFAKLMRNILESSREEYITLDKEIKTLRHYLNLQKLNLEDNFTYNVRTDLSVDPEEIRLPPMLLQPFIENALKHGLTPAKQGHVEIIFTQEDNNLLVKITDNGVGLNTSGKQFQNHVSLATTITKERLSNINLRKRNKIKFQIRNISDENPLQSGTQVTFMIPFA